MPRPKKPGAPEPKRRSRNGCWPCKSRKVKCDETHPTCLNCQRQGETCDYSIRLNWEGRSKKKSDDAGAGQIVFQTGLANTASQSSQGSSKGSNISASTPPAFGSFQPSSSGFLSYSPASPSPSLFLTPGVPPPAMYSSSSDTAKGSTTETQFARHGSEAFSPGPLPEASRTMKPPAFTRVRESSQQSNSTHSSASPSPPSPKSVILPGTGQFSSAAAEADKDFGDMPPNKRIRYAHDQSEQWPSRPEMGPPPAGPLSPFGTDSRVQTVPSPTSTPLTPAGSMASDDGARYSARSPHYGHDSPDIRRLSVNSLLSGPPGIHGGEDRSSLTPATTNTDGLSPKTVSRETNEEYVMYGLDRGFKDLDIGLNDDASAISGHSPSLLRENVELTHDANGLDLPTEFGFRLQAKDNAEIGYYARPVPIKIPRSLEPLPSQLLENPMNLLYFHHYLNHTARVLTPHDCDANPFRRVLPRMALQDGDLLNLLLAYSASHRARLLQHPEPATRIALYVQDIFTKLRYALNDPTKMISNTNLATAIMLASLEIISPKAFGVAVPWQQHLQTAREMIASRGGVQAMLDETSLFLLRWFAYLDVLGGLSGSPLPSTSNNATRRSASVADWYPEDDNGRRIDCLFGFTSRCIRNLAKVAELAQFCDKQRLDENHNIRPDWKPSEDIILEAEQLKQELHMARTDTNLEPCPYLHSEGEGRYQWDSLEMQATNEAYHWAGIAQLERRILGKPTAHEDVQLCVAEIAKFLSQVRKDSTAAACLVFPMFTAGCDALDQKQRSVILERFRSVEECGMAQVHKARRLMEYTWETGKPWETLVQGEFFG